MIAVLARYVVRTVRWQPVLLGPAAGLALVMTARAVDRPWVASSLLFAMMAIAAAVGLAMDDTAGETLGGVPTPLWVRGARGATMSVAVAAASWGALILLAHGITARGDLTVMAGALWAVALAVAAAARRRLGPAAGGLVAAPAVVAVAVASGMLRGSWSLSPGAAGMAWRWGAISAVAAVVFAWSLRDPARIRR